MTLLYIQFTFCSISIAIIPVRSFVLYQARISIFVDTFEEKSSWFDVYVFLVKHDTSYFHCLVFNGYSVTR